MSEGSVNKEEGRREGKNNKEGGEKNKSDGKRKLFSLILKIVIILVFIGIIFASISFYLNLSTGIKIVISGIVLIAFLLFLSIKVPALRPVFLFILLFTAFIGVLWFMFPHSFESNAPVIAHKSNPWDALKSGVYNIFKIREKNERDIAQSIRNPEDNNGFMITELSAQGAMSNNGIPTYLKGDTIVITGVIKGKGFINQDSHVLINCELVKGKERFKGTASPESYIIERNKDVMKGFSCSFDTKELDKGIYNAVISLTFEADTIAKNYVTLIDNSIGFGNNVEDYGLTWGLVNTPSFDSGGPVRVSIDSDKVISNNYHNSWISLAMDNNKFYANSNGELIGINFARIYLPKGFSLVTDKCSGKVESKGNNVYEIQSFSSSRFWTTFNCPLRIDQSVAFRFMNAWTPLKREEIRGEVNYVYSTESEISVRVIES